MTLTPAQIFERIAALPTEKRGRAVAAALRAFGGRIGETDQAKRDIDERRKFHGDPWRYARDIFGYKLFKGLEELLDACMKHQRLLLPGANAVGKTFGVTLYGLYCYDVVGALPDPEAHLEQQGCLLLLPGPTEQQVLSTTYLGLVKHMNRAVRRGHGMPGWWSERAITMQAGPEWRTEALCPQLRAGEEIAHAASGRHHRRKLVAIMEEGQAVRESVWKAVEGSASGPADQIIAPFNPDQPIGPARARAETGEWMVRHLSAFDHPNVRQRRIVIMGGVSHGTVESSIREQCQDLGPAERVTPDPKRNDFVWALLPRGTAEPKPSPRPDGLGHAGSELRVYRPSATFTAQRLGRWPLGEQVGALVTPEMLQAADERWRAGQDPDRPPDVVGVDPARYSDDAMAIPRWGPSAEQALRGYAEASARGPAAADAYRNDPRNRVRLGDPCLLPKGDPRGEEMAQALALRWPGASFVVDQGGGELVSSRLRADHSRPVDEIAFGGAPLEVIGGERRGLNTRASLYLRAAELLVLGLIDAPMPQKLRQDWLAQRVAKLVYRSAVEHDQDGAHKASVPHAQLRDKDEIKREIGRSPDYSDAFVLAPCDAVAVAELVAPATVGGYGRSRWD